MRRFVKIAMAGLFAAIFAVPCLGQISARPKPAPTPQVQPAPDAQSQPVPAAQVQPLPGAQAQPAAGVQGQPGSGRPNQAQQFLGTPGAPSFYYGNANQTPWFQNQAIQKQLNLNDVQLNAINNSYGQYYNQYRTGINQLGNPNDKNWGNGARDTWSSFNSQMLNSAQGALTPAQYQRYQQLNLQHQGMNAYSNPAIQDQLNLTPQQRTNLDGYLNREYAKQAEIYKLYGTNPQVGAQQYSAVRQQANTYFNSVLTPEQRQTWNGMTGDPHPFEPHWLQTP